MEAVVEDASTGVSYNVTSAVSCSPRSDIISNQEIRCKLNVRELLSRIPSCPLQQSENKFYIDFGISYPGKTARVSDSKILTVTPSGTIPELEVNFGVSQPPYDIPELNCMTGSEVDVPVVIHHAETMFGDIGWSFSVNGTQASGIECEKILSRQNEGRDEIYLCTLTVPNILFSVCEDGSEANVVINARTKDYGLSGNFSTITVSEELDLSLKVSPMDRVECQIIDENGTCIPREPQQNVTVTIAGNVPERLNVFETRYKLGDEDITEIYCRKIRSDRYECTTFVTIATLPMPSDKNSKSNITREISVFFDVKYLNYYRNISAKTEFVMEGTVTGELGELINTLNLLEKDKKFYEAIESIGKKLQIVSFIIDTISICCSMVRIADQLKQLDVKISVTKVLEKFLLGAGTSKFAQAYDLLVGNGPALMTCVAGEAIQDIADEQQNLKDFEEGKITAQLDVPSLSKLMAESYPKCRAVALWSQVKSSAAGWACFALSWVFPPLKAACTYMKAVLSALAKAINILFFAISLLTTVLTYNQALKDIAAARERINMQLSASNIMSDYAEKLANTMDTLATGIATNAALASIISPSYSTVRLAFISDRTGVLANDAEICSGDIVTIDYDFSKLSQIENFKSELSISSSSHSKTLHFEGLSGTYGPYGTDEILGTDPITDQSEPYLFTLRYLDKRLDYKLNYVNHACG